MYCSRVGRSSVFYSITSERDFKKKTGDQVFDVLRAYAKAKCLLGASIQKNDDEKMEDEERQDYSFNTRIPF